MVSQDSPTSSQVEILITDIQNSSQREHLQSMLTRSLPSLKIHFDLNETNLPYPCGHTVLRVEGTGAHLNQIKSTLLLHGVKSEEMEDKICR